MKKFLTTALLALTTTAVWAWQPTKPITVQIGFGPGSGNEVSFRAMAQQVEEATGAKFIIVNQPGADGMVSINNLIESAPAGHPINIPSQQNTWVMGDVMYKDMIKFTPDSFGYVLNIARSPLVIIAPADSAVNTPQDLVKLLETTDKNLNFAVGSSSHRLAYEYLVQNTKTKRNLIQSVNYRGPVQAGTDVAAKQVDFGVIPAAIAQTFVNAGKVKIIGLCSEQKLAKMPTVPLMSSVVPGLNVYAGWGILLPKGAPPEVTKWYVDNFSRAVRSERSRQFFEENLMFMDERDLSPQGYKQNMLALRRAWLPVAQKMDFSQGK
jgi:tripartite-type tricarboxylate transporter receptor subunit TctC